MAGAACALVWVYASGEVRGALDGRLWQAPTRFYSAEATLSWGENGSPELLASRLSRLGYAELDETPQAPGQFRVRADGIDVYLRAFETPHASSENHFVAVGYREGRIHRLRDARGERLRRARVEPELLSTVYNGRQEERKVVPIERIPERLIRAVMAAEDGRYYRHQGIDLRGVLRAAFINARSGEIVQGGSTITQQTVKNLFLHHERTWSRKLREAVLAVALDAQYSKDRVLEVYLNEVYLGQRGSVAICGVEAAARFYFGRGVESLTVAESALLAGLIRNPGGYNPFRHEERSLQRREQVLQAMVRRGWLAPQAAARSGAEPLRLASGRGGRGPAPYAVDFARAQVRELFPELAGQAGLEVFTTVDTRVQENGERALKQTLRELEQKPGKVQEQLAERELQAAVVVTRPQDGAIVAMIGGRDYGRSQFNRAIQARRQPGSLFKPFVYLAAFDAAATRDPGGITPASLLADQPYSLRVAGRTWRPANFDRKFRGWVTARRALEESLNVPSIRAAQGVGIEAVIRTSRAAGIESPLSAHASLALGTEEVTPLELATAYGTLARQGNYQSLRILRSVRTESGETLLPPAPIREQRIRPEASFLVNDILQGVFARGTARSARRLGYEQPSAGKTGTTDDTRDSWFVGFDGELLGLVWLGYDDNARTGLTGATGALPVWVDMMKRNGPSAQRLVPQWPDGILVRSIDPRNGRLVSRYDPRATDEYFISGTIPEERRERRPGWFRRLFQRRSRRAAI